MYFPSLAADANAFAPNKCSLLQLSQDIMVLICAHLPLRDRIGLSEVCRSLRDVVSSDEFWHTLISPKLADHAEALHTQAFKIRTMSLRTPFRRLLDGAAVSSSLNPALSSTGLCLRISMFPGNAEVSLLREGSDCSQWTRHFSEDAPGLMALTLRAVCSFRVVTELRCLPKGAHILSCHLRYLGTTEKSEHPIWARPILPPLLKYTCVVTNDSGVVQKRIVLDASAPNAFAKAHIRTIKLFPGQSAGGWNRLEIDVTIEEGDTVTMSTTSTTEEWKTGVEFGCCEAIISDRHETCKDWRMYADETTPTGVKFWNLIASADTAKYCAKDIVCK